MPTEVTDLLTASQVQDAAQGASDSVTDNPDTVVESAIRDVQDMIASYLDRDLIAHKRTERVRREEWMRDETASGSTSEWIAWADHQPVIEVVSPNEVSLYFDSRQFVRERPQPTRVEYFAGWRRSDQTNDEQQGRLTDLATEPEPLPEDIQRVAINLTIFVIEHAGQIPGITDREIAFGGGQSIRTSGVDTGFVDRQLSRLDQYKVSL